MHDRIELGCLRQHDMVELELWVFASSIRNGDASLLSIVEQCVAH